MQSTSFLSIIFTVCESLPTVENSINSYTAPVQREGNYVNGTIVTYTCNDNYRQNAEEIICGVDGTWSGTVECYPGD